MRPNDSTVDKTCERVDRADQKEHHPLKRAKRKAIYVEADRCIMRAQTNLEARRGKVRCNLLVDRMNVLLLILVAMSLCHVICAFL